jgi:hypothetical protein
MPISSTAKAHAQTVALEVQDAYLGGAAVDEREQVSRQGILVHDVPSQRVKPLERQAYIGRLPVQEHAFRASGKNISAW